MNRKRFNIWQSWKTKQLNSVLQELTEDMAERGLAQSGIRIKKENRLKENNRLEIAMEKETMEAEELENLSRISERKNLIWTNRGLIGVAIISLIVATWFNYSSLKVSNQALNDTRKITGLDLDPEINFYATLHSIEAASGKVIPPYFVISNSGPIPAVQTKVEFIAHSIDDIAGAKVFSLSGTDQNYTIGTLEPLQNDTHVIDERLLNVYARVNKPLIKNILEARILYRRESDKKLFIKRAFFFINKDGQWVGENDSSISNDEAYIEMREMVLNKYKDFDSLPPGVPLHTVDFGE